MLKEEKHIIADEGKSIFERKLKRSKISNDINNINKLITFYKVPNSLELFYRIAKGNINLKDLGNFKQVNGTLKTPRKGINKSLEKIVVVQPKFQSA